MLDKRSISAKTARSASGSAARARRLTQRGFGYDKTGNRTSTSDALGVATPYSYAATHHRLASAGPQARTYDAVGNPVQIGGVQLGYDERSRLAQVSLPIAQGEPPSPVWAYQYNGQGWRVAKTAGEHTTHFVYNENAQIIGEYGNDGEPVQEFIWLGNLPIGVIASSGSTPVLHYIESDHLGTPRVVVDATRNVGIWRWNQTDDPFGESIPNADPDGDTTTFTFNLRFAGQYRDAETGWHYNVHRFYDPATGRYLESDPIGLGGGISTYSYVGAAPLSAVDPLGLSALYTNLPQLYEHLSWLAEIQGDNFDKDDHLMPERMMLARLAAGRSTAEDVAFWHHESREAAECSEIRERQKAGFISAEMALGAQDRIHRETLRIQGNSERDLYHWSVRVATFLFTGYRP